MERYEVRLTRLNLIPTVHSTEIDLWWLADLVTSFLHEQRQPYGR